MNDISEDDVKKILTCTKKLVSNMFWLKQDLSVKPIKEHYITAIDYVDIMERREFFLQELVATVTSWVYSKNKVKSLIDERLEEVDGDLGNAVNFITTLSYSKFRPGHPQGQMGELLLFNLLQAYFGAAPLLRKQSITTSKGHERFGADAIHYKKEGDSHVMVVGESKCYRNKYQFKKAFKISLESIESTFNRLDSELNLYIHDDFIDEDLKDVVNDYKYNNLKNVKYELVCLVAYNENNDISGDSESTIKASILNIIKERCESLDNTMFDHIDKNILSRINYIIFPIWGLDALLDEFMQLVGSKR